MTQELFFFFLHNPLQKFSFFFFYFFYLALGGFGRFGKCWGVRNGEKLTCCMLMMGRKDFQNIFDPPAISLTLLKSPDAPMKLFGPRKLPPTRHPDREIHPPWFLRMSGILGHATRTKGKMGASDVNLTLGSVIES